MLDETIYRMTLEEHPVQIDQKLPEPAAQNNFSHFRGAQMNRHIIPMALCVITLGTSEQG